jgi:hypothetical protein
MSDRELLLSFIASITLADHLGDVANEVNVVLKKLGLDVDWSEWSELGDALHEMGVTTLYGTSLASDDEDDA